MNKLLLASGLLCVIPQTGFAASGDGNDLLTKCNVALRYDDDRKREVTPAEALGTGYCLGLMQGIIDSNTAVSSSGGTALVCTPEGVTSLQAARIVVQFLTNHPKILHLRGTASASVALSGAFPCNKSASTP